MSVCDCVTDESECLPWGELSLVNGDHSPRVFSRLQFSLRELFWQFLLRGPRLRTIIHNVFVSYLKNWQRSQIAPIIHISGFWNSCILKASHDCISFFASRNGSRAPGAPVGFTLQERTCARTWLHLVNSLPVNYLQTTLLFCQNGGAGKFRAATRFCSFAQQ